MSKTIKDIKEIVPMTQLILHRMGVQKQPERSLERKVKETIVLPDEEFDERQKKEKGANVYTSGYMAEFATEDNKIQLYFIILRQAPFREIFPPYMHELGHVANMDYVRSLGLPGVSMHIAAEALALAFEGFAKEEYNKFEKGYFSDVENPEMIKTCLGFLQEVKELSQEHRQAYKMLNTAFTITSEEEPDGICHTYRQAYDLLKRLLPTSAMPPGKLNETILN